MKLYVENKIMSIGGGSRVIDETGADRFRVKGKVFSPTRVKKIKSLDGKLLYKVRNKWFNFLFAQTYIKDANGKKIARVKLNGLTGYILKDCADDIRIVKDTGRKKNILKNGVQIGTISRDYSQWKSLIRDAYELEINDDEDAAFYVALAIAIDNMNDKDRRV